MTDAVDLRPDGDRVRRQRQRDIEVLCRELEEHFGLPPGVLTQGYVSRASSSPGKALWTAQGGHLECAEEDLAAGIASAMAGQAERSCLGLLARLESTVASRAPGASCGLSIVLGSWGSAATPQSLCRQRVERLRAGDPGLPDGFDGTESIFAIRKGEEVISCAWHKPKIQVDDHWLHSVGVRTAPDFRNKGLAKAVVSALVEDVASVRGLALWNCDARNDPSLRLALSAGFEVLVCIFHWETGRTDPDTRESKQ